MYDDYEDRGSVRRFMKSKTCPFCKRTGVYFLGRELMYQGHSIPGLMNDALNYYACARGDCQREWSERK